MMRNVRLSTLLAAASLAAWTGSGVAQQGVFVQAAERGLGLLRGRGSDCFALAPNHVVLGVEDAGDATAAPPPVIRLIGLYGMKADAVYETSFEADLALLRLTGGELRCAAWPDPANVDRLLADRGAYLRLVDPTGVERAVPVDIATSDFDYLTLAPRDPSQQIVQGMSGASVMVAGTPVGMLLSVCSDANSCTRGRGVALRIDALARLTAGFFAPPNVTAATTAAMNEAAARAQSQAFYDSVNMAVRKGRPPELPNLKRDVEQLVLVPSDAPSSCDAPPPAPGARTLDPCEPLLWRHDQAARQIERAGGFTGRRLDVYLELSQGILFSAPELPERLGSCRLVDAGSGKTIRTFALPRRGETLVPNENARASLHIAPAWAETAATLPAGEYFASCRIDGVDFDSDLIKLREPILPPGILTYPSGRTMSIGTVRFTLQDADASWDPRGGGRAVITLPRPRLVTAPLVIRFDLRQRTPAPTPDPRRAAPVDPPHYVRCTLQDTRNQTQNAHVEQDGDTTRVTAEVARPATGWRGDAAFTGNCSDGYIPLFEFEIRLRSGMP